MSKEFIINQLPSKKIWLENKEYHFFSGTSYLGLNQDQEFKQLLIEGLDRYGMSFGSSRNGNLQLDIYDIAEQKMAAWIGATKALTVSSGMLAGQLVAQYLKTLDSTFFYAPGSHAANFHEPVVQIPNISFQDWTEKIAEDVLTKNATHSVIVCSSIDALKATTYNFDWTSNLPENQSITLVIDDSHGLGITGKKGAGIFQNISVKSNVRVILVASLHKAMGIAGGVVLSSAKFIETLRHTAFFASCSPIAPAYLYAYVNADNIYQKNRQQLQTNIEYFGSQQSLTNPIFSFLPDYPVFYTIYEELYEYLFKENIFIYSFAYPIKTGKPNTRIVLSAWHDTQQLSFLAEKCKAFVTKDSL